MLLGVCLDEEQQNIIRVIMNVIGQYLEQPYDTDMSEEILSGKRIYPIQHKVLEGIQPQHILHDRGDILYQSACGEYILSIDEKTALSQQGRTGAMFEASPMISVASPELLASWCATRSMSRKRCTCRPSPKSSCSDVTSPEPPTVKWQQVSPSRDSGLQPMVCVLVPGLQQCGSSQNKAISISSDDDNDDGVDLAETTSSPNSKQADAMWSDNDDNISYAGDSETDGDDDEEEEEEEEAVTDSGIGQESEAQTDSTNNNPADTNSNNSNSNDEVSAFESDMDSSSFDEDESLKEASPDIEPIYVPSRKSPVLDKMLCLLHNFIAESVFALCISTLTSPNFHMMGNHFDCSLIAFAAVLGIQ